MFSFGTSSPVCSDTFRYRMRAPVVSSSWLKRTSRERVAETARTGTVTSPKLIVPGQIALGTRGPPVEPRLGQRGERQVYVRGRGHSVHGRGRRPAADAHEPREGAVPGRGLHESRRGRLLRPNRAGRRPPLTTAGAHDGPLARRRRRSVVLREAVPAPRARVGAHRRGRAGTARVCRRRSRDVGVGREPRVA